MQKNILSDDVLDRISDIKKTDILVGIPSFNNANTIGHVVRALQAGLTKYFPDRKAVIVNSDGGSVDNTVETVQSAAIEDFDSILVEHSKEPVFKITTPYHGIPGKGSAFRTIFNIADMLKAEACIVVDSDLRSITPEWVELLAKPVLDKDFDFVSPLYLRHKYDGTITNSIIYPLTRALYGKQVRQPIGGDFGFSGDMAAFYLSKDVWDTDVARYGIDIWMTTTAIANDFRICQSFLGAKIHDAKDPGSDLSAMLYQVVGATFDLMEQYPNKWKSVTKSEPVQTFGFKYAVGLEPVAVNIKRMIERFRLGAKELTVIWRKFLPADVIDYLHMAAKLPESEFCFSDELWVGIIYSFALAAHIKAINSEHLLKALTPLYIGRTASFVKETSDSDAQRVEEKIEGLCRMFEDKKNILSENW
jgi:glycosyltransferase involved in cell wall biosynthesis